MMPQLCHTNCPDTLHPAPAEASAYPILRCLSRPRRTLLRLATSHTGRTVTGRSASNHRHGMVNLTQKTPHSCRKAALFLVLPFHKPLSFRPLYTLRFPREEGVRQRFSSQLTMPLGVFACNLVGDALVPTLRGLEGRAPLGLSPPGLRH